MEHIKQILKTPTPYRGSQDTADRVREEIRQRWGDEAANEYDPKFNARTFNEWRKIGYRVKPGEKSIRSSTVIEVKDAQGNIIKTHHRSVSLFYITQVERVQ